MRKVGNKLSRTWGAAVPLNSAKEFVLRYTVARQKEKA